MPDRLHASPLQAEGVFISGPLCSAFSVAYNKMIMFCILSEICINEEASKVAARLKSTQNRSLRRGILKKTESKLYSSLSAEKKSKSEQLMDLTALKLWPLVIPFRKGKVRQ